MAQRGTVTAAEHERALARVAELELLLSGCETARDGLARERDEAVAHGRATGDVLTLISRSPADPQIVLDAICEQALRLLEATTVVFHRLSGDLLEIVAGFNEEGRSIGRLVQPAGQRAAMDRDWIPSVAATDRRMIHRHGGPDAIADEYPATADSWQKNGYGSILCVPVIAAGAVIGVIAVLRRSSTPFTQQQIDLLNTFAGQAVIAMENTRLFEELQQRNREQAEALERERATSNLLRVISQSPGELQPVFDAIAEATGRICEADDAGITSFDGERFREPRANYIINEGMALRPPDWVSLPVDRGSSNGRAVLDRRPSHVWGEPEDVEAEYPRTAQLMRERGLRAIVSVPLLKNGEPAGMVCARRSQPRPYTDAQIALLETFADQAVIAIENARLFREIQDKTRELEEANTELREALERQTATGEVLEIISSSPANLTPVFDAIAERAARLCGTDTAANGIWLVDGDEIVSSTSGGFLGQRRPLTAGMVVAHALREGRTIAISDLTGPEGDLYPNARAGLVPLGRRSVVSVPMLKDGRAIGAITISRNQPLVFTAAQIELLETFADQAVIAVENARLFSELEDSNRELTSTLAQQVAIAEILSAINAAPAEIETVLATVAEHAARLCNAEGVFIQMPNGDDALTTVARYTDTEMPARQGRFPLDPTVSMAARTYRQRETLQVHGEPEEVEAAWPVAADVFRRNGVRALLSIPLLHEGQALGVMQIRRREAQPFDSDEVRLLETFAAQSAIAIQNAHLLRELRESIREQQEALTQLTASAEVLELVSRSPRDLTPVFEKIAEQATLLCAADDTTVSPVEDAFFRQNVHFVRTQPLPEGAANIPTGNLTFARGRAVAEKRIVHYWGDPATYAEELPGSAAWAAESGVGAAVAVPLLNGDKVLGLIFSRKRDRAPFTDKQLAILQTFARQAVIAIENARLFSELQESNTTLREALEQQTATGEVLEVISNSPADLRAVLRFVAEQAARICDANDAVVYRVDGDSMWTEAHVGDFPHSWPVDEKRSWTENLARGRSNLTVAITERRTVHIPNVDVAAAEYPVSHAAAMRVGSRASLTVPILNEGRPLGVIMIRRFKAKPFTERQIAMLEAFASQAAIAVENARLFNELEARNREQAEALEREQATAEVLRVISQSPENLEVSLQVVADAAARLCKGHRARVMLRDGDDLVLGPSSSLGADLSPYAEGRRVGLLSDERGRPNVDAVFLGRTVHAEDLLTYVQEHGGTPEQVESMRAMYAESGARRLLVVPLMRGGAAAGTLGISRAGNDSVPFSPREIALAETFADQAVIAIENARLFEEIQAQRRELEAANTELGESLEQQMATADVLRIISRAPANLSGTLEELVERAGRLYRAYRVALVYLRDDAQSVSTIYEAQAGVRSQHTRDDFRDPEYRSLGTAAFLSHRTVAFYGSREELLQEFPRAARADDDNFPQARLAAPLLRAQDGRAIGAIIVIRAGEPFTEKEASLLQVFADQAVIAIENARLFEEIQQRTREMEAASRAKSEFLSRMSHELRTPLNAIIGFGEIMEMDPATSSRQHERVRHILQGGRHLLSLINEVLDITRIEAGRLSLSLEPVRLDTVVQEVLDLERPLAADAGVRLLLDNPAAFRVAVQADRQRLRQIILNLVANAIKYNREDGTVTLRVSDAPGTGGEEEREHGTGNREQERGGGPPPPLPAPRRLRLTVADTGPGIPAEQLDRLFAPFERLSAEGSGVEGTGLGLAIARGLAEAMGGAIGVASVAGEGSAFWVDLPEAVVMPALPSAEDLAGDRRDTDLEQHIATILYVEDNLPNVELVQHALEFRPGVTLLTAPDGATGLRLATRYQPDLILLDLNLPDLNGDEVLARLRADRRTAAIPAVMVSADATAGQVERLLAAGARAYLTKPLDVRRFLQLIDEVIAERG